MGMRSDESKARLSVYLTKREELAVRVIAAKRGVTISDLLRDQTVSQVMGEYAAFDPGAAA